jgi:dienelactone hydrolase
MIRGMDTRFASTGHTNRHRSPLAPILLIGALLAACVGAPTATPSPTPRSTDPAPTATPSPTPLVLDLSPLARGDASERSTADRGDELGGVFSTPSPTATPTATRPAPTPRDAFDTPTPTLTVSPTPSPTPDPLAPYTITALAARTYGEGDILVREELDTEEPFQRYVIEYPSDGITVTGLMDVPYGEGPFPVVIVLHGYIAPERYRRGDDSLVVADYFARRGYAAIMPDYRGYMGAAGGPNPLRIPYAIDVLNLVESLDTLDALDATRVGLIGHSMGGGVAAYLMVLSERVDAVVLYGAMSADQAANWAYIGAHWSRYWMAFTAEQYGSPEADPARYAAISPISYLDRVHAPVQLHHGTADGEVPIEWSRDLAARLADEGVDVALYEYEGAGHTFFGADLGLFLERVGDFMGAWVG